MSGEPTLGRLALYFLELGATGFGGPIALTRRMQKTLVEERKWIDESDFVDGLALAQLAPGPLAAQLATYIGYVRGGAFGATVVSIAFVIPSFLIVWALAVAYVRFGGLQWIGALFYGVGAAVVAIIARSAWKLAATTLRDRAVLWAIFGVMAVVTAWTEREILWLFVLGGLIAAVPNLKPQRAFMVLVPAAGVASATPFGLFLFFAKAGAFVFGSGLAIVPFLYGEVVQNLRWLDDRQFLDAVAVAMITPGPVVITVAFIGYLVAGHAGMVASAIGVFLPAYLIVLAFARRFRDIAKRESVRGFVEGVTAAASGAMAGAAIVLGRRAVIDVPTAIIAALTLGVLIRWKRSDVWLIAAAGAAGLALKG